MKTINYSVFSGSGLFVLGLFLHSCKRSGDITISAPKPEQQIVITLPMPQVVHLYHDTVYILDQNMVIDSGQQLIIDEGTLIKVNGGSITVNPGGKLLANGTSQNPIVFTANASPGTANVNWDGIVLLGKSFNNAGNTAGNATDASGSLHYVRIEFGRLVLSGVGSGTTIENIQVSYAGKGAAFEINGGTFNARYLVSYACGGPSDFYITEGYTGKLQHLLAYRHPYFGAKSFTPPNALAGVFIENNPNDTTRTPYTYPVISNLTVLGPNGQAGSKAGYSDTLSIRPAALITTGNARFRIRNSLFLGFPEGAWYLDDSLTADGLVTRRSELTWSIVHSNDSTRTFYLKPGTYPNAAGFKSYMLGAAFHNLQFTTAGDFMFNNSFSYDSPNPDPMPKPGSPVLTGADFSGGDYSDAYFNKVAYKGALGSDNWLRGWVNFNPLQTNYNYPQ